MWRKVGKIVYFYPENVRLIYTREFTVRLHSVSPGFYKRKVQCVFMGPGRAKMQRELARINVP
jgi:hypothetical protein